MKKKEGGREKIDKRNRKENWKGIRRKADEDMKSRK